MKIHRFINNFTITNGEVVVNDVELIKQIKNVLRLKVGERVMLGNSNMDEILGEITEIGKIITIKVLEESKNKNEPSNSIVLYCSILKKENFELVAQKATEVGVKEIIPVITSRTVKLDVNIERVRKIIKEAAEQSGRGIVPNLHEPMQFESTIQRVKGLNLFFDASGTPVDFKGKDCNIFIGPEGGWDLKEIELAKQNNFSIVSLGKLTLRAETAAIIACYEQITF